MILRVECGEMRVELGRGPAAQHTLDISENNSTLHSPHSTLQKPLHLSDVGGFAVQQLLGENIDLFILTCKLVNVF